MREKKYKYYGVSYAQADFDFRKKYGLLGKSTLKPLEIEEKASNYFPLIRDSIPFTYCTQSSSSFLTSTPHGVVKTIVIEIF